MEEVFDKTEESNDNAPIRPLDIHSLKYGDEVIREGELNDRFFVILSGQIRISEGGKKIRILETHDVFGLESSIFRKPSQCTARALTKSRIASYGPEALDYFIRENPRMTHTIMLSLLQQLEQTSQNMVECSDTFALEDVQVHFFNDGEVVIEEGTAGTSFYRLVSSQGGLRVSSGGQQVSVLSKPGEFFGEMDGLLRLPRRETVVSIGESVVEEYNLDDLDLIVKDYPDIAVQIMRSLVHRLDKNSQKPPGR